MGGFSFNATENLAKLSKSDRLLAFGVTLGHKIRFYCHRKVSKQTMASTPKIDTHPRVDQPVSENGLPSPSDLPESLIVIYDGKCSFCTTQVQRLHRWDGKQRLAFVSLHDPFVTSQFPELTEEMLLEQMYVIDRAGNKFGGAAAFCVLTRTLPRLWIIAPILHIPFSLPLWQWMYMQVARRRYLLGQQRGEVCEGDQCEIHFGDKS